MARIGKRRPAPEARHPALDADRALIALCIAAMDANGHVAPDEAERAHHLIWSTQRFRRDEADYVARLIEDARTLLEERDTQSVLDDASRAIPARQRASAFAILADLVLADGRIDARERRFLRGAGAKLGLRPERIEQIVDVMLLKNRI